MPPHLLVGPRAQRADLARRRAQRPQSRGWQLALNQPAHAQRLEWPNAAKLVLAASRTALGRRWLQHLTMLPRVRVRSQTIETKLVENLEGLDVLLAPRGGAAGGAQACSHARHQSV